MYRKTWLADDIELVISGMGEWGFKEVTDDFAVASEIYVLTYNISDKSTQLIDKIRTPSEKKVTLITNIPRRFEKYFTQYRREIAEEQIDTYQKLLDPSEFNSDTSIYYCLNNHSKIVATERIAYVGSANYSDESSRSIEVGVLISSQHAVQETLKAFQKVKDLSIADMRRLTSNMIETLRTCSTEAARIAARLGACIRTQRPHGSDLIDQLETVTAELEAVLDDIRYVMPADNTAATNLYHQCGNALSALQNFGNLRDFISFDTDRFIAAWVDGTTEDTLDTASEVANDRADEAVEELRGLVSWNDAENILKNFSKFLQAANQTADELETSAQAFRGINNTAQP